MILPHLQARGVDLGGIYEHRLSTQRLLKTVRSTGFSECDALLLPGTIDKVPAAVPLGSQPAGGCGRLFSPFYLLSLQLQATNTLPSYKQATETWGTERVVLARAVQPEDSLPRKEEINQCLLKE